MKRKGKRLQHVLVVAATVLFLSLPFNSVPSAIDQIPEPPDPEELALLEELAEWLTGIPSRGTGYSPLFADSVVTAIKERPRSFELFRRYHSRQARRQFLQHVPYGDLIYETAQRYHLDSLLLAAMVEAESAFVPHAVSSRGAMGLLQVMPGTARAWRPDNLLDPAVNLDLGARYLKDLLEQFDGDLEMALAAYNAGPTAVARYGGVPPFRETQNYVDKVLSLYVTHHQRVWETAATPADLLLVRSSASNAS